MDSSAIHYGLYHYPLSRGTVIFLAVLVAATSVAALVPRCSSPRTWMRTGAGAAFVVAGLAHFAQPTPFEQHLPGWVPAPTSVVFASGAVEVVLGIMLLGTRHPARVGRITAAFLVAVWPANVYVAVAGIDVDGQPDGLYPWARLALQPLFIWWVLWSTGPTGDDGGATSSERAEVRHAHG